MRVFTVGFTKTSAESFFTRLQKAGVKKVLDVRLNNVSQLAGFAKKNDLHYFLKSLCGIEYTHRPELAPTQEMLDAYKKHKGQWEDYEKRFLELMMSRQIEEIRRAVGAYFGAQRFKFRPLRPTSALPIFASL